MAIKLRRFSYEDEYPQDVIDNWSSFTGLIEVWQEDTHKITKDDLLRCDKLDHKVKMNIKSELHDYYKAKYHDKDEKLANSISNEILKLIK